MTFGSRGFAAALFLMSFAASEMAQAEEVFDVVAVPTAWRLENYVDGHKVMLWFTGAPQCTNGNLSGSGMSQDDYNRLWSLILTAKANSKPVSIRYTVTNGTCNIVSFLTDN
ncbi:hypothetical protein [Novosphingobium sp.]|jgi:hypothetical protein|uniref:hypothetical protein n=1 Tax=Novosphingobium sp. TaxID=1874826 RepID=UPI002FE29174